VVYSLFQDQKGYLWIGTQAGISLFDGRDFTNFNTTHGLTHNTVRFITQTRLGMILIATDRGVTVNHDAHFQALPHSNGTQPDEVRHLLEAKDGSIWGASLSHGLFQYTEQSYRFFGESDGLPGKDCRVILQDSGGRIWAGFYGIGLFVLDNQRWSEVPTEPIHKGIRALHEDSKGVLFIGTNAGLYSLNSDKTLHPVSNDARLQDSINTLVSGPKGGLWIGTNQFGAVSLMDGRLENYHIENGLSNNGVQCILVDNENKLWFGTYGGGVCRLGRNQFLNITSQENFEYHNLYAMFQDEDNSLWLGTNGGGLTIFRGDRSVNYKQNDGLRDNKVFFITKDSQSRIWIATLNGVNYFQDGQLYSLTRNEGLPHNLVFHILPASDGRVLFATLDGLGVLTGETLSILTKTHGLSHNRIHHILERKNGEIWLGSVQGISVMIDGEIQRSYSVAEGMQSDDINHLLEAKDGRVWIATTEGISVFDQGSFTNYSIKDGLSSPLCNVILEDDNELIWIGTANGLNRFDGKSFTIFSNRDGLPSNEINRNAGFKSKDGYLWFGTTEGATRFKSISPEPPLPPPFVNITGMRVMGESRFPASKEPLKPGQNLVEIHFRGISFSDAENLSYTYRLEGFSSQWISTDSNQATYVNLPPGHFTFSVRARNSDGVWSTKPASVSFSITPPFWRKTWFITTAILGFLLLVWFQLWRLRRQNDKLEEMVEERTQKLNQLALWDQLTGARNRHFLDLIMPSEMAKLKRDFYAVSRGFKQESQSLGIAMLDIDHFKTINDNFGHQVGDLALAELATRLKSLIRESDSLIRWGGEEFLLVLPRIDFEHLTKLADRLRKSIAKDPLILKSGKKIVLQISIGFTLFPFDHDPMDYDWRKLVNLADITLYEAKKRGRNMAVGFNPEGYLLVDLFKMIDSQPERIAEYLSQNFTVLSAN